jgi:hypothetical protein
MGARNVPDRDTTMIAPVAALVADHDLHPALVAVLAQAALDIHSQGTVLRARQHVDLVRARLATLQPAAATPSREQERA